MQHKIEILHTSSEFAPVSRDVMEFCIVGDFFKPREVLEKKYKCEMIAYS